MLGAVYGGSCFPKDIKKRLYTWAKQARRKHWPIVSAVEGAQCQQNHWLLSQAHRATGFRYKARSLRSGPGVSSPGRTDIRDAPSLVLIDGLLNAECDHNRLFDPVAMSQG